MRVRLGMLVVSSLVAGIAGFELFQTREPIPSVLALAALIVSAWLAWSIGRRTDAAHAQLARNEQGFAKTFDSSPVAILVTHLADGRILNVNAAACELFGYEPQQMRGRSTVELGIWVEPGDRARVVEGLRATGSVRGIEHPIRRKSGEIRTVRNSLEEIELDGEKCIVGSMLDITEERRAIEALRDSEARMRVIAENLPATIVYFDQDRRVRYANRRYADFYAGAGGDIQGWHLRRALGDQAWAAIDDQITRVLSGEAITYEREAVGADGERRDILANIVPHRSESGEILGGYGLAFDVTKRRRAEGELRARDAQLRLLTENIPAAVAYVAPDLTIQVANQRFAELHCGAGAEVIGRHLRDVVGEKAWPEVARRNARVLEGEAAVYERTHVRPDGERREIEVHLQPDRRDGGAVCGHYAFVLEITERKRAEEALRVSELQLRLITENIPAAIAYVDRDLVIRLANPRYNELFFKPGATAAGRHVRETVGEKAWPETGPRIERVLAGETLEYQRSHERPDGERREIEVHLEPDRSAAGEIRGYYAFVLDITERIQMQQQVSKLNAELEQRVEQRTAELQGALRDLETFTSAVSHDLRGPTRRMAGFAGILREELGADAGEETLRLLGIIEANAEEMGVLVDALLRLARISHQPLVIEPVDLAVLAREAWEALDASLPRARVELRLADLPVRSVDRMLVKQVLINLLGNAVKFSARGEAPVVEVGVITDTGEEVFYVRDNGAGFDIAFAQKLFKPFSRLHARNEFEGTGIGLSIVELIARRHGGRVWAEGMPGQGATVHFSLGRG
ncbi:MAG: PAS domain S-box protein [Betaproteobacteria bacterium]|nr:PAS domain S-box protein [Betaproteobacteria bacterium]